MRKCFWLKQKDQCTNPWPHQDLIAAIGIACVERRIVIVLLSYAGVYAAVVIARERIFSRSGWTKAVTQAISTASSIAIGLALCVLALRWFALYQARKSVRKDKKLYDGIWKSIMNDAESLAVIRDEVQYPITTNTVVTVFR
jgi:hypothetical protein